MRAQDVARDGQPQPGAAGLAVPAALEAPEGGEDILELRLRDARPVILDREAHHPALRRGEPQPRRAAIGERIADKVRQRALERDGARAQHQPFRPVIGDGLGQFGARIRRLVHDGAAQRREVDGRSRFRRRVVAREGEGGGDHLLHLVEVGEHLPPLLVVVHELGAQPQPRDGRAQVVADRGQHLRAVRHEAADALGHLVEGARGDGDLRGPLFGQRGGIHVAPQPVRGLGQQAHRPREPLHRPQDEQHGGDGHDREGHEEGFRMPGPRRGQFHADVQPFAVGQAQRGLEAAGAMRADPRLARAKPRRARIHEVEPEQPHDVGRRRRRAQAHRRMGVEIHAQPLGQVEIREHRRAPVRRREHRRAPGPEGAPGDLARLDEALQVHPVQRMDREARGLHQHQRQDQPEGRAPAEARGQADAAADLSHVRRSPPARSRRRAPS